jgi:molybdenum cofactor synthesis domain-containing protein
VRPFRKLIPIEEALEIGFAAVDPIDRVETVPVRDAAGRVVAREVRADVDVPPFDRAAMDGYAVCAEDTVGAGRMRPVTLDIRGAIYAGEGGGVEVGRGTCVVTATAAVLAPGADAVVMVENTEIDGDAVRIMKPVYPGENVSRRGEDIEKGSRVLEPGDVLNPARIGAVCAVGLREVPVFCRPRVAVIATGGEIAEPGEPLGPGQIYNVNSYTLVPLIQENGCEPVPLPVIEDTLDALESILDDALDTDLVVFTGGSSVGDRDRLVDLFERRGEILYHGIMVKPGKPTLLGKIDGTAVLGMPGYPTSCLSNGYLILEPMLRKMARLPTRERETVVRKLERRIVSTIGRHQFYPVRIRGDVASLAFKESGAITSMSAADGYIEIPADVDLVEKGEEVRVTLF